MKLTNYMRDAFIRAAMDDVPNIDHGEAIRDAGIKFAVAKLPPKVRALWNDKELRGYIKTDSAFVGQYTTVHYPGTSDIEQQVIDACEPMVAAAKAQRETRDALQARLRSVAYACTTRKALLDALPEFEKYLPQDDAAVNRSMPVVSGVVTEFVKAGWPKKPSKK